MEKIQKFVNVLFLTFILMPVTLFIFPVTYAIADGSKGASYLYEFGGPLGWITVSNDVENKSGFIDAAFKGNTGITIHWSAMLYSFFMILVAVYFIIFIIKKVNSKHNGKIGTSV
ncbi:hypothetical protein PWEIH_00425 [Listeria weihenstephanensis FSL R9-0317]|uniref:Uncharacterized protein n=1 Tax=Listeria weihenstephanensis TaxID=1006155 RepID=A0A1S7FSX3_9LIST|nr:hypothetical protein [Listeria weihenstephanensis]AQY50467.1 hypothetical protein UE46_05115 [Listeria weihenstephanensis]EUJ41483.1 hypothetical protein PWEIH_00425 [Listeria weihenstephanensis FSL R9-0317]